MLTTTMTDGRLVGQDQRHARADEWPACLPLALRPAPIIQAPCASHPAAATASARLPLRPAAHGFTLIELMIAVAVTGVVSSVALPSFEGQLQRARRADALVSLMQLEATEERFRSNGARYGSLAEIGAASASPAGHYNLQIVTADAAGYEALATATGVQARDTACRVLKLSSSGMNTVYASGTDASVANPADVNRRCWNR